MLVLTIKTDQPEAEIELYNNSQKTACQKWLAHRQLSVTIHKEIKKLLMKQNYTWKDIKSVVFFAGPGSFTGLRIGAAVAAGLANGLDVPVVSTRGKHWIEQGLARLEKGENDKAAVLYYGARPNTSKPKK